MNLYLVSRTDTVSYDEYGSFLMAAESAEQATFTLPDREGVAHLAGAWDGISEATGKTWTTADNLCVVPVGITHTYEAPTIIITSFNAG